MTRVELRLATPPDAEALARTMRKADALEVRRSCGLEPLAVLQKSMEASGGTSGALLLNGELAAIYGIVVTQELAIPWLLTSDVVERHKRAFFRTAKTVVDLWASEHPVLLQMVDDEYKGAQVFLERLGFRLHPAVPHGPFGAPFRPALRTKDNV